MSLIITSVFLLVFVCNIFGDLLIHKCCPPWQLLNYSMDGCIALAGRENIHQSVLGTVRVSELKREDNSLWWMNETVKSFAQDTFTELPYFLDGQDDNKFIEMGGKLPCDSHMAVLLNTAGKTKLLHNGSLIYTSLDGRNITFSPHSYCTDAVQLGNKTGFVYLLCSCLETTCIKKCCSSRKMLSVTEQRYSQSVSCIANNGSSWRPEFYDRDDQGNFKKVDKNTPYVLYSRNMACGKDRVGVLVNNPDWWIFPNGSVLVDSFGHGVPFGPEHYCADLVNETDSAPRLMICAERVKPRPPNDKNIAYSALFIIGAIFLVLTLIVFALLPRRYRDLLAKSVICHCACLLLYYIAATSSQLSPVVSHLNCILLAFIIQFSFLAAFFWLNVMCIDISWAFSGFRPPQGSALERDRKKFIYYSLYAWGSPIIIFIVTAIMEFVEEIPDTYLKPDFGIKACWFKEKSAAFAYFYGPMAVLLLINFALFIYTTVKIIKVQRDTRILHNGESGRHDGSNFKKDKKRLILYSKLFCLMGLTWITEIISWLHGSPQYYWYVTDAINLLRAVFIFIIFCCKRKVYRLLKQRLFPSLASKNNASQSNGTRKSSGSTQNSSLQSVQLTTFNKNTKVERSPDNS